MKRMKVRPETSLDLSFLDRDGGNGAAPGSVARVRRGSPLPRANRSVIL
jgi:hypothetical protein